VSARAEGSSWPRAHVALEATIADSAAVGDGTVIHAGVSVGADVRIGSGAVIHAGTELGERCTIEDGAVLGKRPRLRASSNAPRGELEPLIVGADVTICCGAVLCAGARIEPGAIIGDQAHVRERARIGEGTVVGRGSAIEYGAQIGAGVLIQTGVYVTAESVVEDDVFLGPGVVTSNDDTMGRHPRGEGLRGPIFRRACRVGAGAVLVPGVVIGDEAYVAAGAVVTADVPPRAVVMGVPARVVRRVSDADLLERWR
jgi:acetyltransferase-like isoleucine patch superfamily enzyme